VTAEPDGGEQAFVEAPFVAQGEALPAPPALLAGPFRRIVVANFFGALAFWASYGVVFWEAANRFGAEQADMAVLGASLSIPFIFGSLIQGLVVDKWSPKWLLVLGYLGVLASIPLAWAATSLPWLWGASFLIGGSFATIEPSRSALTGLLVPEARLVQANGAIATAFQAAIVLGSLGGGWLLDAWGADTAYAVAAMAAVAPLALLASLPDLRQHGERPAMSLSDLRRGARAAWDHPQLRILMIVTSLGWTLINVFFILEPLFVKDTLARDDAALLYLWAAHGAGALAGAVTVTQLKKLSGKEAAMVCLGVLLVGTGILAYTAAGSYPVALAASAFSGIGFALFFPPLLALIQRVITEDQRGRVTSVFVALQESMGFASSMAIFVLGALVIVRPVLIASGLLIGVIGGVGLRAVRVSSREVAGEREPA
jgi:predicted MFS family arabinose efflux permease